MDQAREDAKRMAMEAVRLTAFLRNNQLVQANAIAQKLESMAQELLCKDGRQLEKQDFYVPYRCALKAKASILAGKTEDALQEAEKLLAECSKLTISTTPKGTGQDVPQG
jgi:hypothetical protein